MNERIKMLRKFLKLNQADFSQKLGIGNTALSKIETGENPVTEQNIRLICLTFGVSEEWLRKGTGEMFSKENFSGFEELLTICQRLYPENQKLILTMAKQILETQRSLLRTPAVPEQAELREAGKEPEGIA